MDESWRMRTRMPTAPPPPTTHHTPNYPPRRSDATADRRKPFSGYISDDPLNPEDFSDVFGGPPRMVLSRQSYSTGFQRSSSSAGFFYDEIFRPSPRVWRSGRSLPEFRIPCEQRRSHHYQHKREQDGFYSDIFGWDNDRVVRSRSRSKTCSSSVLSSEELSPLRGDDDASYFASNLRPINVNSRWDSKTMMPPFAGNQHIYSTKNDSPDSMRSYPFRLSPKNASPETISLEPISNCSFRVSADDSDLNSPSSGVCNLSGQEQTTPEMEDEVLRQDNMESESESDDEAMSSYVIEINSDYRDGMCESNGVDEAIAWAKKKFQQECQTEKPAEEILLKGHQVSEGNTDSLGSSDEQETQEVQTELEILDEKIRLWSTGKQADIRLLLSSLHYILWPDSGWLAIPLANIMEISKVKKAYQKARLCLHPDKLQQRGATLRQKYIAEKAFSVLQDAWAVFISRTENFMMV